MSELAESRPRLLEPISAEVEEQIQGHLGEGEDLLIRVCADLDLDGRFTTIWVAVTEKRVVVVPGWSDGSEGGDSNGVSSLLIDATPKSFDDPDAKAMPHIEGHFSFEGVIFGYDPGKPVLKGVDLEVAAGEMIGLVGKSGVGKSTLINLVCRFYDADRGILKIDGEDIRSIKLGDLRSQIGMVAQESFLFNGSIADNISYGKREASFEEIIRAAKVANAHEFIVARSDGYDTRVRERGDKLSGGEKQGIAIARAILHDPKILILYEATSSVDTPTEKKMQEAIKRLVAGRTTFAIAHRLSTLRSADRLVVLDEGKVAEVGTHEELMEREGIFYDLVKTQQETTSMMAVGGGKDDPSAD